METLRKVKRKVRLKLSDVKSKSKKYIDRKAVEDRYFASEGSGLAGVLNQLRTGFRDRVYKSPEDSEEEPYAGPFSLDENVSNQVAGRFREIVTQPRFDVTDLPDKVPHKFRDMTLFRRISSPGRRQGPGKGYYGVGDHPFLEDPFELIPKLKDLVDEVCPFVEEFYSTDVRLLNLNIKRTHRIPSEIVEKTEVYSNYWHVDGHPIDQVKVFVCLSDIKEDTGPFHYLGYEESRKMLKDEYDRSKEGVPGSKVEKENSLKKFTGTVGDCMICNTNTILHRAGNPQPERSRDLLTLQFAPVKNKPQQSWGEQVSYGVVRGTEDLWSRLKW